MTVVKEPDQNTTQIISKKCIYLRPTRVRLLVNMKYVICVFYQDHSGHTAYMEVWFVVWCTDFQ